MPYYVQTFRYGRISQNYHRKYRKHNHPDGPRFTRDAVSHFAQTNGVSLNRVEVGTFRSGQSRPPTGSQSI